VTLAARIKVLPVLLVLATPAAELAAQQYRAFWADAFHSGFKTAGEIDELVENVARARGNAIFMQARRRGDVYYLRGTSEPPAQDASYSPNFDALQYLIERAHARGIEVHAWFVVYPLWLAAPSAPPQNRDHLWHRHGPQASGDDMWMSVSSTGLTGNALDPGHPEVLRYLADVITEPARHYDIDGIHLDYIRYSEDADYGWNPKAVERFRRLENRTGAPGANDAAWSEFRRRQVSALVRQVYLRAFEIRPSIRISAALISWGNGPVNDAGFLASEAYRRVFQSWRGWLEEGILDLGIPMHYFREAANAAFLDRWLEFAKDRQYRRAYVPGLAPYLNSIPETLAQIVRALAPSPAGNLPLGVNLYSYASTNTLNAAGAPITPNTEFYRQAGELFGQDQRPPELAWKTRPERGHLLGWLNVEGGPAWLKDGAVVRIESDTGREFAVPGSTDATGFFGAVDLPPDRYRVRIERGGRLLYRATPQEIGAGGLARFDIFLKPGDFEPVLPRIRAADRPWAAPGDVLLIEGANLAPGEAFAASVPLPQQLAATQVLVNQAAAPLFFVEPGRAGLQLPFASASTWEILVRHSGMESAPLAIAAVDAAPVILAVRVVDDRFLEIYATGLGRLEPPLAAGAGADPTLPLPRVALPVRVRLRSGGREHLLDPLYAGSQPYQPARYQVNAELPAGVRSGTVELLVGPAVSSPATW